jgi:hypothetical protein
MKRIVAVLPLAALALAACTHEPVTPAPAPVVVVPSQPMVVTPAPQAVAPPAGHVVVVPAPAPLRAGFGRVESISSATGASAGATAADETRRFTIRMDDGTMQYIDARAPNLGIGHRVEITRDGYIRSPV